MFKKFQQKILLFTESLYNEPIYLEHYSDDVCKLTQYTKDRTFNEMRRDVFFDSCNSLKNEKELTLEYTSYKNDLKQKNKLLHDLFLKNNKIKISTIIKDFDIVEINKTPNAFKKEVSNGRFIYYDGNSIMFLGEDDLYFYVIDWQGS